MLFRSGEYLGRGLLGVWQGACRPEAREPRGLAVDRDGVVDAGVDALLVQMGEISLLTRDEEIQLAKRIDDSRASFRRQLLTTNFGLRPALEILEKVKERKLPLDRTLKVPSQDEGVKEGMLLKLPKQISSIRRIAWKQCRSCSADSLSMWLDSLASSALAG